MTRVPLAPHLNFRDVGGYPTLGGGVVRRGAVYRSAHLHEIEETDRSTLQSLEVRTVCDLRHPEEASARPTPFATDPTVEIQALGMLGARVTGDPVETILEFGITRLDVDDLVGVYRALLEGYAHSFGRVIEACARPEAHAVVVHCSAGKDRTGVAIALLLSALEVPDDVVVADYEMTNELWSPHQMARAELLLNEAGVEIGPLRTYFLAPAEAMQATLAHLRDTYGSVAGYLTGPAGVTPETIGLLRAALVDGAPLNAPPTDRTSPSG